MNPELNKKDDEASDYARNIKRAQTLRNVALAVVIGVLVFFILLCFGVLPV